jgi:hypothetical protein
MSSATVMERFSFGAPSAPIPSYGTPPSPAYSPTQANWCVLPRCEIRFEKCKEGFKIHCSCEDEVACGALQNLCKMLAGGLCSCYCTQNGITVCHCNFCSCNCKCDYTKDGCCITCTSGDKHCCEMLQAFCNCLSTCQSAGCCCFVCFNNTPVCCSIC